jgi:dTDP-glucose 4,6-dehydratase
VEVVGERLGKDAAYKLESSKIRQQLSWQDEVSLEDGLSDCIEWVKLNLGDLKALPWDYIHKP